MNIMIYHVMICGEQNGRLNNLIHLSENEVYPPANNRGSFGGSKQNCWFCSLVLGGHFLNLNDFCVWQFLRNKIADSDLTLLKVNQTLGNCPFWYGIFQSYSYVGFIRTVVPNMPTCSARVCQRSCSRLLHPKYLSSQGPEPEAVGKFLQKNDNDKENTWVCLKIMSPQTMPSLMGKLWLNIKFGRCPPFFWVLTWDLYTTPPKKTTQFLVKMMIILPNAGALMITQFDVQRQPPPINEANLPALQMASLACQRQNPAGDFQSKGAVIKTSMPYSWWLVYSLWSLCAFMGKS